MHIFGMLFWWVFYIRGEPETPVIKVKAGALLWEEEQSFIM